MKAAYPIILSPAERGYVVTIPDLDINTEGDDIADAIYMATDAIGLYGICRRDMKQEVPPPSRELPPCGADEIATYALVDFDAAGKANDMRAVRKNVTLPGYLNDLAEKAGLNFSRVLQDALREKLQVN